MFSRALFYVLFCLIVAPALGQEGAGDALVGSPVRPRHCFRRL